MHERRTKWNKNEQLENRNELLDIENMIMKIINDLECLWQFLKKAELKTKKYITEWNKFMWLIKDILHPEAQNIKRMIWKYFFEKMW